MKTRRLSHFAWRSVGTFDPQSREEKIRQSRTPIVMMCRRWHRALWYQDRMSQRPCAPSCLSRDVYNVVRLDCCTCISSNAPRFKCLRVWVCVCVCVCRLQILYTRELWLLIKIHPFFHRNSNAAYCTRVWKLETAWFIPFYDVSSTELITLVSVAQ